MRLNPATLNTRLLVMRLNPAGPCWVRLAPVPRGAGSVVALRSQPMTAFLSVGDLYTRAAADNSIELSTGTAADNSMKLKSDVSCWPLPRPLRAATGFRAGGEVSQGTTSVSIADISAGIGKTAKV